MRGGAGLRSAIAQVASYIGVHVRVSMLLAASARLPMMQTLRHGRGWGWSAGCKQCNSVDCKSEPLGLTSYFYKGLSSVLED